MNYQRPAKTCGRCRRSTIIGRNWPEGFVCASCVRHGVLRRGRCAGCAAERALPGLDGDGQAICVDCAGIPTSFRCTTCGVEDEPFFARTCHRCSLRRRLLGVLDDGSGAVAGGMLVFFEALATMPEPRRAMKWLNSTAVRGRLSDLATGIVPLTHAGIDTFDPGFGREYLRDLLMLHGALPAVDKCLMAFERFEARLLRSIEEPADRQTIRVYLRWRHHRELEARAVAGSLTPTVQYAAQSRTHGGVRFLEWLRGRNVAIACCKQVDLDAWFATAVNASQAVDFLRWAMRYQRCPRLVIPSGRRHVAPATSPEHRTELLARLLSDDRIALSDRVVGCLVVLLAQPITRVCALRISDIKNRDGEIRLGLGDAPVVLPEAVGALLAAHVRHRPHMLSAANVDSPWLFPGNSANQHIRSNAMSTRMAKLGITKDDRKAALQQLLRDVPAPVVAKALGLHPNTTAQKATELGTDWAAYAALRARQTPWST